MAMKLGRALLHKTKTLAGGGGGGGDEEKSEPKGVAEAVGSSNDAEAGAKPSDLKLRRGEEELLSPQQLVQYKSLLKSYEVRRRAIIELVIGCCCLQSSPSLVLSNQRIFVHILFPFFLGIFLRDSWRGGRISQQRPPATVWCTTPSSPFPAIVGIIGALLVARFAHNIIIAGLGAGV